MGRWGPRTLRAACCLPAVLGLLAFAFADDGKVGIVPADLVARYRQTLLEYPRPRVVWRFRVTLSEAFFESFAKSAGSGKSESWEVMEDIWSDGKRVFARMSRLPPHIAEAPPADMLIRSEDLVSKFRNCCLYTWDGARGGVYRLWQGVEPDGSGRGEVGIGEVDGHGVRQFRFPPLLGPSPSASRHSDWSGRVQTWHWGDAFFALDPAEMRIVGRERVGDRMLYRVEHRTVTALQEASQRTGKKVEGGTRLVAWVDLERGGLVMRLERHTELLVDGRVDEAAAKMKPKPLFVGEVLAVMHTGPGRYYPKKGLHRTYYVDPRWKGELLTPEERVSGKAVDVPVVEVSRMEWEVERVEPDVAVPDATLALPFPKGTPYYDRRESRLRYEGLTDAEVEKMLRGLGPGRGESGVARWWFRWIVLTCNVVALVLVGLLLYRRYRR